ncbi:unnamed protein product [Heterobilharzia americana]|nr:unnamed protein product [Heterobilharzia americana]
MNILFTLHHICNTSSISISNVYSNNAMNCCLLPVAGNCFNIIMLLIQSYIYFENRYVSRYENILVFILLNSYNKLLILVSMNKIPSRQQAESFKKLNSVRKIFDVMKIYLKSKVYATKQHS